MQARKALLLRLASITDWETSRHAPLDGECWLETRNTLYRFRDRICVAVAGREPRKHARARVLVGMRLVGWLSGTSERSFFSYEWEAGACAVLWRSSEAGSDEAMALTSPTTTFARGASPAHLQALHDRAPPRDSQSFRREPRGEGAPAARPRMPSTPSYRSG